MAVIAQINDLILLADGYLLELGDEILAEQQKGCSDCGDVDLVYQILELQLALQHKVETDDMGEQTDVLYACLQSAIQNYSGASITVDPNAKVPSTTIDIEVIGNDAPYEIMFGYNDFVDNGEDGRVTYENPAWANWIPLLQLDNVALNYGVAGVPDDYEVLWETGGIRLLNTGNMQAIYNGQVMRSVGYEPYSPPVFVPSLEINNQSSLSITYDYNSDGDVTLTTGQSVTKQPLASGAGVTIAIPSGGGHTLYYSAYDYEGTLVDSDSWTNPPTSTVTKNLLSHSYRHVFDFI